jgi:hypothetical protein
MKKFKKGEVKPVGIKITNQDVIIDGADYEVLNEAGTKIEYGVASINGLNVTMLFSSSDKTAGVYYVKFILRVTPQILIKYVPVQVIDKIVTN